MVQVQVNSASEIAYLQQVAQGQVPGATPAEVKTAQGILAQLGGMTPSQQDSWLAQNLPLPGSLVPGSQVPDTELDAAINSALDHYGAASSLLIDLSPDDLFAILAKAAIHSANGELRNAESSRAAAYQMAAAAQLQQAGDLRSEADTITSSAGWQLAFTCLSSAVQIGCAAYSLGQSIDAAGAQSNSQYFDEAAANAGSNPVNTTGDPRLNLNSADMDRANAQGWSAQATRFNARSSFWTSVGGASGNVITGTGGMFKAHYDSEEKGYEADSASEGALADSFKQAGGHADSLVQQTQSFISSMIEYLRGYQDAHNQALQAATRA
jgi:hypothetical protein